MGLHNYKQKIKNLPCSFYRLQCDFWQLFTEEFCSSVFPVILLHPQAFLQFFFFLIFHPAKNPLPVSASAKQSYDGK